MMVMEVEKKELKKHVSAIRVSNDVGLLGRKIWNALLFNAYDDMLKTKKHIIPIPVLSDVIGYNSKSYTTLDKALIKLQTTLVEWDIGEDATNKGYWHSNIRRTQMLGGISLINGVIEYEYPSDLPKLLYNPSMYQIINIAQQRLFKGTYSLALWENASRFLNTGTTGWSDVDEWRKLLGANAKTYNLFKHFNNRVISPSIKEINNVSDINITLKVRKFHRRVVSIGFDVKKNNKNILKSNKGIKEIKESPQYQALIQVGIHKVKVISFIEEYGHKYIQEKIEYTQSQDKAGNIKSSLSGYLVKAIENDWKSQEQVKAIQKKAEEIQKNQEKTWKEQLTNERDKTFNDYLLSQNEQQKQQLKKSFEQSKIFQNKIRNRAVDLDLYQAMKTVEDILKSTTYQKHFFGFIMNEYLDNIDHLKTLKAWKEKNNIH